MKIPKFGEQEGPEMRERFFREARAAATLRHAHICPVYDVGQIGGVHYLTMAYIEGRTLAEELRGGRTFQSREIARILRKLAQALDKAHAAGIVHRDLKPGNIMLDADDEPVLMDFGLAYRAETDELRLTRSGMIVGSPAYMSPEQLDAQPERIGPHSDIYSLGVVLYEMLTGKLPFMGNMMSVIGQIAAKEPPPVGAFRPELADSPLEHLCRRMMAKQPADRPPSMQAVAGELASIEGSEGGIAELAAGRRAPATAGVQHPAKKGIAQPVVQPQPARRSAGLVIGIVAALAMLCLLPSLGVVYWTLEDGGTLRIESHVDDVQVEIVGKHGVVKVLDLDTGSEVQRLPSGEYSIRLKGNRNDVQLTHDGFTLKRGQTAIITARRVERAPSPTSEPRPTAIVGPLTELVRFEGHESYALKLDFSPDGWRLVTACGRPDTRVLLWDARNGRLQREYKFGERSLHTVAFSPDGKYVASGGKSGEIILLDAKELKEVRRWKAHEGFVDCLEFSPDSRRLASGSDNWSGTEGDVSVRVWDVATGNLAWKQDLPQIERGSPGRDRGGQVFSVAYSPNGQHLMTAHQSQGEQLTIWQAESGKHVRKFGKAPTPLHCAAWSPDGRLIATGHVAVNMVGNRWTDPEHCVIRLYDPTTGSEIRTLTGHTGPVESLDFSPDSKLLASGSGGQYLNDTFYERESSDNSIRIWDVESGRELFKHDLPKAVKCVRFSPGGNEIASSAGAVGDKADVRLWRLPETARPPESVWPTRQETAASSVDLLKDLDPQKHVTAAPWERGVVDGFTFRKGKSKYSSLVPDVGVSGDYDLQVELTRTKGDQPAITFPVGDAAATLVLGRVQDQIGGLEIIDSRTVSTPGNPATFRSPLLDDVRHSITIQVRLYGDQAHIICKYDDKPLTQWRGDPATLSVSTHWRLPQRGRIGLGAWCERGSVTYHQAALRSFAEPDPSSLVDPDGAQP